MGTSDRDVRFDAVSEDKVQMAVRVPESEKSRLQTVAARKVLVTGKHVSVNSVHVAALEIGLDMLEAELEKDEAA